MSKFKFGEQANRAQTKKAALLVKMANDAIHYFKIEVFDSKSFNGVPWTPNKKQGTGYQQLVKTGRMRNSIRILRRTNNSIDVGTNVPYAKYHNEGTSKLPKRQFIGETKKLKGVFDKDIAAYLRIVGGRSQIRK
jgi:phage gpG-like protein